MPKAKWKNFTKEELEQIVKESTSFVQAQVKIGYEKNSGSASKTLKKVFDNLQIDYSHFKGHAWNKLDNLNPKENEFGFISNSLIKDTLIKERGYKCECCGIESWLNKPIILQLHHINGDSTLNIRSNLLLLCPNCHSQTDNWCNRNKNKSTSITDEDFLEALSVTPNINAACNLLGITANQNNYRRARKLLEANFKE